MGIEPRETSAHPQAALRVHEQLLTDAGLAGRMVHMSDGARLHVVEQGSGRAVVLVHGSGSSGA